MNDQQLDDGFRRLKQELEVNLELKQTLRTSFVHRRKKRWMAKLSFFGATAALIAITLVSSLTLSPFSELADASSLKISNQISFVDIGSGATGVAEHAGTVYVPVAGKGVFAYNDKGFQKVLDGEAQHMKLSEDGKQLLFTSEGSLTLYHIETGKKTVLLEGKLPAVRYDNPSWINENKIFFVKKTGDRSEIYQMDMGDLHLNKVTNGDYPFLASKGRMILERDGNILLRDLADGSEMIVDHGHSPAVSPDKRYVSYVKSESKKSKETTNTGSFIDNIWVADLDFLNKKQVTFNIPQNEYSAEIPFKPTPTQDGLAYLGLFSYTDVSWSSDNNGLFVIKEKNGLEGPMDGRIMRIELTNDKMSAEATVKRFIQALVLRDDDFAKSLMKTPPPYLTFSNPRCVGFNVVSTGMEGDYEYVDAEVYWSDTATPYYQIQKSRYYLSPNENGFIIHKIKDVSRMEIDALDGHSVKLLRDNKQSTLFEIKDIPQPWLFKGNDRIGNIAYHEPSNTTIFTLQKTDPDQDPFAVRLLSFNGNDQTFTLLDEWKATEGETLFVSLSTMDPSGKRLALDLHEDDTMQGGRSHSLLYDLDTKMKVEPADRLLHANIIKSYSHWWDGDRFIFEVESEGKRLFYKYNLEANRVEAF
ncbi:hypothetical protein [Ammoniphilus sp. CFH 90114]|uniref:TolB family protein n=1 Tax=Ammoniphilus sp. CFH 90114 TaxID=2493665 RepID=UPI00100E694F|nr:hypothetical protein [Ammoniphilus sp. CFH 90114]RXT00623.1 hypothetical protein EIZ39_25890 [Ammoniphilus sp. CFH 90114]